MDEVAYGTVGFQIEKLKQFKGYFKILEKNKLFSLTLKNMGLVYEVVVEYSHSETEDYCKWVIVGNILVCSDKDMWGGIEKNWSWKHIKLGDVESVRRIGVEDLPLYVDDKYVKSDRYSEILKGG